MIVSGFLLFGGVGVLVFDEVLDIYIYFIFIEWEVV